MNEWKCSGCGIATPDRVRVCDCATVCVFRKEGSRIVNEVKVPDRAAISEHCHKLIGQFYEKPPNGIAAKDVDLIKAALRSFAKQHERGSALTSAEVEGRPPQTDNPEGVNGTGVVHGNGR